MSVGFYNFNELHNEDIQKKILERFAQIVSTNAFVEGQYNDLFEDEFAQYVEAKHCLLVANGTDALEISLKAYDIAPGDKVAISAISFFATAECVVNIGAIPVFVDVDPQTGLLCPDSFERVLKENNDIKAVIPVHIYGMPAPIEKIEDLCKKNNIVIVEDGAQSHGGKYENGRPIGSSSHLCTYSFYPTKNLGAFGDAGAITTQSSDLSEKIKSMRNHGRSPNGHILYGRNSRCDHLQAAVLHTKFQELPAQNINRREAAKKYFSHLEDLEGLELVPQKYLDLSSWHLFPVRVADKDKKYALSKFLKEKGIGNALFYEKSLPEELPCADIPGEKDNAIKFAAQTLCLPMNPFLKESEIEIVCSAVKEFLNLSK